MYIDPASRQRYQLVLTCTGIPEQLVDYLKLFAKELHRGTDDNSMGVYALRTGYVHYDYDISPVDNSQPVQVSLKNVFEQWAKANA